MKNLARMTPLLSSLIDPVVGIASDSSILWANPAAELLLCGGESLSDRKFVDFISKRDAAGEILDELPRIEEGEFSCEVDLLSLDQYHIPVEMTLFKESNWNFLLAVIHTQNNETNSTERLAVQALHLTARLSGLQQTVHELSAELLDRTIQLSEEKNKTEAVLSSMGEGLMVIDHSGVIAQINDSACRILDITPEEVLGKMLSEIPDGSKISSIAKIIPASAGKLEAIETHRLNVQEKVVELSIAAIHEKESTRQDSGIVLNIRDVTRQAELDRMKTDLISIVSHEIRSPLANVIGYIDLILTDPTSKLSEDEKGFLGVARKNGAKLTSMVDAMLDLSRLDAGKMEMRLTDVDMEFIMNFALLSFRNEAESRKIRLVRRIDGSPHAYGDVDRLQQVLSNLLSNAIKYTPNGGEVCLDCEQVGEHVILKVRDNGIGIRPEDQAKLFQRFFRVRSEATRKVAGTGLGLSIAKSIIEAHSGMLTVASEYGQGTTFTVSLPAWKG